MVFKERLGTFVYTSRLNYDNVYLPNNDMNLWKIYQPSELCWYLMRIVTWLVVLQYTSVVMTVALHVQPELVRYPVDHQVMQSDHPFDVLLLGVVHTSK